VTTAVIAHRGASGTAPENTLAAFRRAVDVGADMIELDVQLARDGTVVVIHDYRLERTTSGRGLVGEHTLAELGALDAGRWFAPQFAGERVPTLAEVLAAAPIPINVELKAAGTDAIAPAALAVVEAAGALDRVVFSSFDFGLLEQVRSASPRATIGLLWDAAPLVHALPLVRRVGATGLHLRNDRVGPEALALAAAAGVVVRVWTVNRLEEFRDLVAAGVAGVFTDFPERFLLDRPPVATPPSR